LTYLDADLIEELLLSPSSKRKLVTLAKAWSQESEGSAGAVRQVLAGNTAKSKNGQRMTGEATAVEERARLRKLILRFPAAPGVYLWRGGQIPVDEPVEEEREEEEAPLDRATLKKGIAGVSLRKSALREEALSKSERWMSRVTGVTNPLDEYPFNDLT